MRLHDKVRVRTDGRQGLGPAGKLEFAHEGATVGLKCLADPASRRHGLYQQRARAAFGAARSTGTEAILVEADVRTSLETIRSHAFSPKFEKFRGQWIFWRTTPVFIHAPGGPTSRRQYGIVSSTVAGRYTESWKKQGPPDV